MGARRLWETSKRCPSEQMLRAELSAWTIDPSTAAPMRISQEGGGMFLSPVLALNELDEAPFLYEIRCPSAASQATP